MQPVTVAEVADELYALPPADFTAARDERARQARAAGQRDEAAEIKKLARPTASAWLINRLAREAPGQLDRLAEVGRALEEAQRTLAGDRLRELSGQRRQLISELLPQVSAIAGQAGQPASPAVLGEVRATLEAALADAGARAAVRSGRLTKALAYAGIGEVDLAAALALPADRSPAVSTRGSEASRPKAPQQESGTGRAPARSRGSAAQRAAEALQTAQSAAADSEHALAEAEQQVAAVAEQRQFLKRRVEHLERELRQAKNDDGHLARDAQQAQRARDAAARRLETARRQLGKARRQAGE